MGLASCRYLWNEKEVGSSVVTHKKTDGPRVVEVPRNDPQAITVGNVKAPFLRHFLKCSITLIPVQPIPVNICNVKISKPIVVVIAGRNSLAVSDILDSNMRRDVLHSLSGHVAKHRIEILVVL